MEKFAKLLSKRVELHKNNPMPYDKKTFVITLLNIKYSQTKANDAIKVLFGNHYLV